MLKNPNHINSIESISISKKYAIELKGILNLSSFFLLSTVMVKIVYLNAALYSSTSSSGWIPLPLKPVWWERPIEKWDQRKAH